MPTSLRDDVHWGLSKETAPLFDAKVTESGVELLNRAGYRGENVVRIRTDQAYRAHDDHQDHCQHDGVFRDILTYIIAPELKEETAHTNFLPFVGGGFMPEK
jgi:hypothetical protein